MTTHVYCTYFDRHYLSRGLALYRSLQRYQPGAELWVLCLDEEAERTLGVLDALHLRVLSLKWLEEAQPALTAAKATRSRIEYYFTLTPSLIQQVRAQTHADRVTYLDADLYFFHDPSPIEREIGDAPIAIIEHRFPPALAHLQMYGRFNVGWLSFSRAAAAGDCLERWESQTIDWCYDRLEGDKFADQKYLDEWPHLYGDAVHVVDHPGANVAPWNLGRHRLETCEEGLCVDGTPVLFFHFHGMKQLGTSVVDTRLRDYGATVRREVLHRLYAPYVEELATIGRALGERQIAPQGIRSAAVSRHRLSPPLRNAVRFIRAWKQRPPRRDLVSVTPTADLPGSRPDLARDALPD